MTEEERTFTWRVGKLPPRVALTAPCWLHEDEEEQCDGAEDQLHLRSEG
jgi:hypothetical protein